MKFPKSELKFFSSQHPIQELGALNRQSDLDFTSIIMRTHYLRYLQEDYMQPRRVI